MKQNPPGWYTDTERTGNSRYWDGSSWTEHRPGSVESQLTAGGQLVTGPRKKRAWWKRKRVLIPAGLIAVIAATTSNQGSADKASSTATTEAESVATTATTNSPAAIATTQNSTASTLATADSTEPTTSAVAATPATIPAIGLPEKDAQGRDVSTCKVAGVSVKLFGTDCTEAANQWAALVPSEAAQPGSEAAFTTLALICNTAQGTNPQTAQRVTILTADALIGTACPGDRSMIRPI